MYLVATDNHSVRVVVDVKHLAVSPYELLVDLPLSVQLVEALLPQKLSLLILFSTLGILPFFLLASTFTSALHARSARFASVRGGTIVVLRWWDLGGRFVLTFYHLEETHEFGFLRVFVVC